MSRKVKEGYNYANITTATTTVVKSGEGIFAGLVINNQVANGITTIYDNTAGSGTKIATITAPAAPAVEPVSLIYNIRFTTGLTIVTSQAEDLTVAYS